MRKIPSRKIDAAMEIIAESARRKVPVVVRTEDLNPTIQAFRGGLSRFGLSKLVRFQLNKLFINNELKVIFEKPKEIK